MEFRKSYTLSLKDYMTYNLFSHRKQLVLMPVVFFALMTVAWVFIMLASSPDLITLIVVILLISLFYFQLNSWPDPHLLQPSQEKGKEFNIF